MQVSIFLSLAATLTPSWQRFLSRRNNSIDLQSKSMDWFLYDRDVRHEKVKLLQILEDYSNLIGYRKRDNNYTVGN